MRQRRIAANIAEGAGHQTMAQFAHFLTIALGSANETESHLILAANVGLVTRPDADALLDDIRQIQAMLFVLRRTVLAREAAGR